LTKRLYSFEEIQISDIADEYSVSRRTITRDMQKISSILPLYNNRGKWSLDLKILNIYKNDLNHALLHSFAHNIQIETACLDKRNINPSQIEFAINYSKLPKIVGEKVLDAINREKQCSFVYAKREKSTQRVVDSIRLYTQDESWYLIAKDHKNDKIKTFLLTNIKEFKILDKTISFTKDIYKEVDKITSNIWHNSYQNEALVKLYIKPKVAHYIERKKIHTSQTIVNRHYDGGLEVHCKITNELEILPAIKSWLPYIMILEPS